MMRYPKILLAQHIVQLCKAKDITHIVVSPGSRNAPLVIGFTHDNFFECYSIADERCAAFFALGLAQQLQKPVALVCTSGSAVLNYYPAVSEAFYSDIPLVIISADRPAHKIDIGDGQTIRQPNIFANHIVYSANLKNEENAGHFNVMEINKALNTAILNNGPVHLNAPFEEPLYEMVETYTTNPEVIPPEEKEDAIEPLKTEEFVQHWNTATRKMILVGVLHPGSLEARFVEYLAKDESVIVFTETTSNLHHENFFPGIDKIIAPVENDPAKIGALQPELLLTFGGMIVSKKIKAFLRTFPPKTHYHVDAKKAYNTYFCLTHHFKTNSNNFFTQVSSQLINIESPYRKHWLKVQQSRREAHDAYVGNIPFSDFEAYAKILKSIPDGHMLQSSNSATIRYIQLFDINPTLSMFCNRGTSGIDGSTSTAIGASLAVKEPTTLITGDLSFFYDSNALWNACIRPDFRIILVNNSGGGIFRIISPNKNNPGFDTYFETTHQLTAKQLCEMYGFNYIHADDSTSLTTALASFYKESKQPKLLEVFTPRMLNDTILLDYFRFLNKN